MPVARANAHLVLRPGVHVVRRDDRHLQVGLEPPQAVVLPDDAPTRRLLEQLRAGEPPVPGPVPGLVPGSEQARVLATLDARGLLVPVATRDRVLRAAADRHAAAGVLAGWGPAAGERLANRAATRVAVTAPVDLRSDAVRLLRSSGLAVAAPADRSDMALVVSDVVLPRAELDALVRAGRPHLVVGPHRHGLEVGPLVVPGTTACLRCVDAHRAERDPRRSVVLEQYAEATRAAGPVPRDPALLAAAVGLAVRDVVCWADGEVPLSWSASLVLRPALAPEHHEWRRHPHCGCAWDELAG